MPEGEETRVLHANHTVSVMDEVDVDALLALTAYVPPAEVFLPMGDVIVDGQPELVYEYPKRQGFTHAIYAGKVHGVPSFAIGARGGDQEIFLLQYHPDHGYNVCSVEAGAGPSNVCLASMAGKTLLLAANREKDEAALYDL